MTPLWRAVLTVALWALVGAVLVVYAQIVVALMNHWFHLRELGAQLVVGLSGG